MKVLFTLSYGQENFNKLKQDGFDVEFCDETKMGNNFRFPDSCIDADCMVCFNPFLHISLEDLPKLKWIQLVSVGFNHVPRNEIESLGLSLTCNVGTTRKPIAEWVVTQILQSYKQTRLFNRQQEEKLWRASKDILELSGKKVVFLGAGNIAQETARKLKAFDAVTCALNRSGKPAEYMDETDSIDEIDRVLPEADIVICTLPATPETYHLLSRERLSLIREDAVLVNISRGTVIDEAALCDLLEAGRFRAVALDVFENEPLPSESPLWSYDRVFITPHNALFSDMSGDRVFDMVYTNLVRFRDGLPLLNTVNYDRGY